MILYRQVEPMPTDPPRLPVQYAVIEALSSRNLSSLQVLTLGLDHLAMLTHWFLNDWASWPSQLPESQPEVSGRR